ncbi:MAG: hypothetical protein L3J42_05960 [Hydrogenimonas sp.]|nr:hypothetical protein [Hydrogenimonas sp.]
MKREILVLTASILLLGGCAQKGMQSGGDGQSISNLILEQSIDSDIPASKLKKVIETAAKSDGWMVTSLGERKLIAEKFFSETKNIAAEIAIRGAGYAVEYSSGQNIGDSEAKDLIEELKESIDKKLKEVGGSKE